MTSMATTNVLTLDPAAAAVNIHLTDDRWEASCPACGYVLAWATEQDVLDTLAARVTVCPICHPTEAA
jgi:Zn finger protein HypA/HybF involved in hydrogenase expression